MKKSITLLPATAALLSAVPALAQEAQPQGDDSSEIVFAEPLEPHVITVTALGIEQRIDYSGRSVSVLTAGDIERTQTVSLSDALALLPGVSVSRNGGVGSFTGVRIRGAEAEQTLVLIDGVRVNDPSSPAGTFDFGNLLSSAVRRVDVQRGPNSVVWGSQAIGGVVNVLTEDGTTLGTSGRGSAEGGSFGTASANAAVSTGNVGYQLALTGGFYRTDGISAAASGSERDGYRQYGATARGRVDLSDTLWADVRGYFADSRTELDGFPPPSYALADNDEYSTARELYGYAGLHLSAFGKRFENTVAVSVSDIHRDNFDPAAGAAPAFFGRGSSERYEYRGDARIVDGVRALIGAEHEDSRFTDGATPASTAATSGYAALVMEPLRIVTINAGVRRDHHRDFGGHTSVTLSGTVNPNLNLAFRASYNEGFKAPTLYQLHSFFGDPGLKPETARSYEVGATYVVDALHATFDAAWFRRDTRDQIDFDLGTFTYGNIDKARARGFELGVTRNWGDWYVIASYTHLAATNRSPGGDFGNDLARRPRDFASLSVDYWWPHRVTAGVTLRAVGPSFDDPGNTVRLGSYFLMGVRGSVPIGEHLELYARVENLFDRQYQTVAGYGTPGRAAHGGVRVKFD